MDLTIQWIPSHVGVQGNEHVDGLAGEAHALVEATSSPLDQCEAKKLIDTRLQKSWQRKYEAARQDLHIGIVKATVEHWPWTSSKSRKMETAMARLRIGHTKLKQNLFRFNLADDPNCSVCRTPETPAHLMESCQRFNREREKMHQALRRMGIYSTNLKTLLGGGQYDTKLQEEIKAEVELFLSRSGAINLI